MMPVSLRLKLTIIILLGIAIREALGPFTGHPFDFELWIRLGYYVARGNDPYTYTSPVPGLSLPGASIMSWIGYPPTWAFFQAGLYSIYVDLGVNNRFVYYFLIKQPMIIADILVGLVLYKIVSSISGRVDYGFKALSFWILCPFTILISSVWGMFDQIILLIVLAAVLLISKTMTSASIAAFGFVLKVIPIIYMPLLAFVQKTKSKTVLYLTIAAGESILFSLLPYAFFRSWNIYSLFGVGMDVTSKIGNSMNYWVVAYLYYVNFTAPPFVTTFLRVIGLVWIPAILVSTYYSLRYVKSNTKNNEDIATRILISMLFITLIFFLTKSAISEQFTLYFLGLGVVDYYILGSKERRILFHLMWVSALVFAAANNTYFVRFLRPLSLYYSTVDSFLTQGALGEVRMVMMLSSGIVFTVLCILYARSLFLAMRKSISTETM